MTENVKSLFREYPYYQRKNLIKKHIRITNLHHMADQVGVYPERHETAQRYRELAEQETDDLHSWLRQNPPDPLSLEIPRFGGRKAHG